MIFIVVITSKMKNLIQFWRYVCPCFAFLCVCAGTLLLLGGYVPAVNFNSSAFQTNCNITKHHVGIRSRCIVSCYVGVIDITFRDEYGYLDIKQQTLSNPKIDESSVRIELNEKYPLYSVKTCYYYSKYEILRFELENPERFLIAGIILVLCSYVMIIQYVIVVSLLFMKRLNSPSNGKGY